MDNKDNRVLDNHNQLIKRFLIKKKKEARKLNKIRAKQQIEAALKMNLRYNGKDNGDNDKRDDNINNLLNKIRADNTNNQQEKPRGMYSYTLNMNQ